MADSDIELLKRVSAGDSLALKARNRVARFQRGDETTVIERALTFRSPRRTGCQDRSLWLGLLYKYGVSTSILMRAVYNISQAFGWWGLVAVGLLA